MPTAHYGPWSTQLKDRTDNQFVISQYGELQAATNPLAFEASEAVWFSQVAPLDGNLQMHGREGRYSIQAVLFGETADGGAGCAWEHARVGNRDNQLWNATTTDPDEHGEPFCRFIPTGSATPRGSAGNTSYRSEYSPPGLGTAGSMDCRVNMRMQAFRFAEARDQLTPWGVFDFSNLDFEAAGLPDGYFGSVDIEWEDEEPELLAIDITADDSDRDTFEPATDNDGAFFSVNDAILPGWLGTEFDDAWQLGIIGETADLTFDWFGEAPVWHSLGFSSWADLNTDGTPDTKVAIACTAATGGSPGLDNVGAHDAHAAVRYTLRSPRFRLIWYTDETVIPPRRIYGRPGDDAMGAKRVYGGGSTVQDGRIYGGIL